MTPASVPPPPAALDLAMLRKYPATAPRYTSYPPATKFLAPPDLAGLEQAIAADDGPLSLYFHLPFCESLCWYCGCNTVITTQHAAADRYLDLLGREIELIALRLRPGRPVTQVHLGGGTPTFFSAAQLRRLATLLRRRFTLAPDCEFGVEIDPRHLQPAQVDAFREIGVNRASLGVQDTNPAVQLAIHRWQPKEQTEQAVGRLRGAGITSINFDLIYGLPLQTPESFGDTLDAVIRLQPTRCSVFSYAHVPWLKPAQRIFEQRGELPSAEAKLAMAAVAHERLTGAGFVDIGLDHFARPGDELAVAQQNGTLHRNFQGYSTAAGASLYGFGISSISSTPDSYRQNHKDLAAWTSALEEGRLPVEKGLLLTTEDRRRRALIMRVMCDRAVDFAELSAELGIDVPGHFAAELAGLQDLVDDGLVERDAAGFRLTPRGGPLLRIVAMRFDATFTPAAGRHAQAV